MTPEKWKQVKSVFNEAVELPAAERGRFLSSLDLDADIIAEVNKMIAADGESLLKYSPLSRLSGHEAPPPEKIGSYRVERELGRGGMGVVYLATRDDGEFERRVALKIIKGGMHSDEILRRFRNERQILAELQHPFIGRLFDGGVAADGSPFFAMEYVEGSPVDVYCREKNLPVKEKLELFREICAAVSYAHQNLVVHRDIKPSNILITRDGSPRLLDFGIAKVLTGGGGGRDNLATATQLGMMTPAYASPEQLRGERVTTATDVYSLGVVLYELLTGERPYRTEGKSYGEMLELVCHSKLSRPSIALSRSRSAAAAGADGRDGGQPTDGGGGQTNPKSEVRNPKSLSGDIDNIVLKALQKEPARRYQTVQEFSEDVRRHLVGLPVAARPDTLRYRFGKFVRRNRVAVVAAALIFVSLCAGIAVALWQARRAAQARVLAENRFNQVRSLANSVVFKYHDAIAELQGSTAAREMLVKDALRYLDALAAEAGDDPELQNELALAYLKLGDVQGEAYAANLGDTEGALASYRKAIALFEAVVRNSPDDVKAKKNLIRAYDDLALLLLRSGGGPEPEEITRKALKLHESLPQDDDEVRMQLVELLIRNGDSKVGLENLLREHLKALPVARELVAADPDNAEKLKGLMRVEQRLGSDYQWLGDEARKENRAEDAREYYRQSLEHQRRMFEVTQKLYSLDPEKTAHRRYLAIGSANLAQSLNAAGRREEALEMLEKASAIARENLRLDPKNNEAKYDLSVIYGTFGEVYRGIGDYAKAEQNYRLALGLDEDFYRTDQKSREVQLRIRDHQKILAELAEMKKNAPAQKK